MRCGKCASDNRDGRKFCGECGAPLNARCAACGAENEPAEKFCGECGVVLAGKVQAVSGDKELTIKSSFPNIRVTLDQPDASAKPEGERKTVTALFADLKGSTALMETLDPEEARAIIDPALRIMVEAVGRYEGYVVQSTGDGIFALFGAPAAYEDHPQRALYAALQMQQQLREHGQRRAAGTHALEARVGVNTGEVVVRSVETGGKAEYTPIGHTANLASRLQTLAPIGSIAVSEHTRKLCEGYFELRALGPMAARGVREAINVYEVAGLGTLRTHFELAARRGLTKFVGREHELQQMRRALGQARSGHGQLVAVVAEAGSGKSRLFHEFKAALSAEWKSLEAYSISHGNASAWLPVLELLRRYFGLGDTDDPVTRREKVRWTLDALDPVLQDTLPYLFGLLGIVEGADPLAQMDPQVKRQRTFEAIKRVVIRESLKQPLLVIFEDLHWIDAEAQDLLDLLADSIANTRILILVNYRPEYRHDWGHKAVYTQLRLDPLGQSDATSMLSALLENAEELAPLRRMIIERTGGNPFFIEETVQALFDDGALARNGTVTITRPLDQLRLPPTVQGLLASRIDRLSPDHKDLLQTLSVIGRKSSLGLLRLVAKLAAAQLERLIADLRASEFIFEQTAAVSIEYVFKHALTQEVAYNSLLIERRKQMHEHVGRSLESIFSEELDDHLTQLAHHYSHSDNLDKAIEYLSRAGQQAMQRSAHADAIGYLAAGLDLLQKLPDTSVRARRELPLQLALGQASRIKKGYSAPEVKIAFTRARALCESLGDPPELCHALYGLWMVHLLRGERTAAYDLAKQLLSQAEAASDRSLLLMANGAMGKTLFEAGQYLAVRVHLERAVSLNTREHDKLRIDDFLIPDISYLALTLCRLGYLDQALKTSQESIDSAHKIGRPFLLAFAEHFASFVREERREAHIAQEKAEHVIALSAEHGFPFWLAQATSVRGQAIAEQGRTEEGIELIREGLEKMRAIGMEASRGNHLSLLAKAVGESGRLNDAFNVLQEALATASQKGERKYEAEMHRLKGELLLKQSDSKWVDAQMCFEHAIEIARSQSAKSFELRATMSLARLLEKQGRRTAAYMILSNIYNWFTEGFDTTDLKDAKSVLDQLAE